MGFVVAQIDLREEIERPKMVLSVWMRMVSVAVGIADSVEMPYFEDDPIGEENRQIVVELTDLESPLALIVKQLDVTKIAVE